ncbi:protein of unknown function [Arachidicoccus rhizosphaerae]|uniref:Uncharacterized protein n=1 Tax=Arachidicoccus rhizosphaerae TaxID=551991 RepID=A0A1H4BJX7_9BACT|nr:DUF4878 domain-containing protein [Arachidicoccus rhizosphaerae]SEA48440.1 protein of unknown function [Arachidicoccus rhizosphaerae]
MKKNSIWLAALLMLAVTVYSCKSSTSPSDVAKSFETAMLHNDFTKGKTLVTASDQPMLDQGEEMTKSNPTPDSIKAILNGAEITASNEKMENDSTATVDVKTVFKQSVMGQKETTNTYVLKKEKGAWKIDLQATIKRVMESYGAAMQGQGADSLGAGAGPDAGAVDSAAGPILDSLSK